MAINKPLWFKVMNLNQKGKNYQMFLLFKNNNNNFKMSQTHQKIFLTSYTMLNFILVESS